MKEIHLIIIWSEALSRRKQIVADVSKKFTILDTINITWDKNNFSNNLSRFYGEKLPRNSYKEKHCGNESFTCIIVRDNEPKYEVRDTSKGAKIVNINLFDVKQLYRSWTGGGHKIHATDNTHETKIQLVMLIGKTYSYYLEQKHNILETVYKRDLIGTSGWESLEEVFEALNETLNYVILRNFEGLEDELDSLHPDIDLLVENKALAVNLLNAKATSNKPNRVQYNVVINNKNINFDLRYIGDNYYCERWERNILNTRIKERYFFRPNEINLFYSFLYHAVLHKNNISKDYVFKILQMSRNINLDMNEIHFVESGLLNILTPYIDDLNYNYIEPKDLTVLWNIAYLSQVLAVELSLQRRFYYKFNKFKHKIKSIFI